MSHSGLFNVRDSTYEFGGGDRIQFIKFIHFVCFLGLFLNLLLFFIDFFKNRSTIDLQDITFRCTIYYFDIWMMIIDHVQLPSHVRLCDAMDCSTPGLSVPHHLLEVCSSSGPLHW